MKLRIGTRSSKLALWQTRSVAGRLEALLPEIETEIVTISTHGDASRNTPLFRMSQAGIFTKRIEEELYAGSVDIAVHSLKDMPTAVVPGLVLAAFLPREDPRDVLVSRAPQSIAELPEDGVVASGSLRRRAQVLALRPDLEFVNVRGNIETRLRKFRSSEWDGMILAYAGMHRLGLDEQMTAIIGYDELLPAVGQGIMTVECREEDEAVREALARIDDTESRSMALAERALLRTLQGGCQVPVGAHSTVQKGAHGGRELTLDALVASLDGTRVIRDRIEGHAGSDADAEELGTALATQMIDAGAAGILEEIRAREGGSR